MSFLDGINGIYERIRGRPLSARDDAPLLQAQAEAVAGSPEVADEGELISLVTEEFERRKRERLPFENQWKLNINFLEGNQFVDVNPVSHAIEEIPQLYEWQEREVFNMIGPNIETRLSRMLRMSPVFKVLPGSNDNDDARSAKVSNALLKTMYYDHNMQIKQATLNAWMEATGTCLMKHVWNSDLGRAIGFDTSVVGLDGAPRAVREGDLEVVVCPPQEIFPDNSYRQNVSDCNSIIHAKAYHVDEIEEIWGKKVAPEQVTVTQLQRAMVGAGGLGYNGMQHNYSVVGMKDFALVKEYWEMPGKKYPQGRLIIIANGVLLHFSDRLPYKIGEDGDYSLPFTKVVCVQRIGCFWGKSIIERMVPLQRRYNAVRNRKAEFLNRVAIGQWTVEEDAVDLDYLEENAGSPGLIIQHNRGSAPPVPVRQGSLPGEFESEVTQLLQEFSILSGVSELSRQSNAPTGVKSGVAIQLALEQDDTRLAVTVENIQNHLVECGKIWLRFYKQYAQVPRVLRIVGENNVADAISWDMADIKSDDVVIEPYSAMAESPAQRRQMVFDLISSGILAEGAFSKETRNKMLEMLQLGNWESLNDSEALHIARAQRENISMKEGTMTFPAMYDDHALHVYYHDQFRLSVEYEELSGQYPQIAQMFDDHIAAHVYLAQPAPMTGPPMQGATAGPAAMTPQASVPERGF
jgi:hypothetical protein